ncbi:DUF937 domain-containing protein [Ruminococcaceae bacterium OttesenSCG-928-A16]|nr:DUF937 domain-containing protein [Ruminococcaceae bacterium OttesenSCG-928-A16]
MSLLNSLMDTLLSSQGTAALSSKSGADADQVQSVVSSALPMLLQSMANNAKDEEGAASLASALASHAKTTDTPENQLKNADTEDGSKILGHLLGGQKEAVEEKLAVSTKLSSSQVSSILSTLAPLLLSQVGKKTQETKTQKSSGGIGDLITSLVTGKSSNSKADSGNALGGILDFVMQDKDGDGKGDILSSLTDLITGK